MPGRRRSRGKRSVAAPEPRGWRARLCQHLFAPGNQIRWLILFSVGPSLCFYLLHGGELDVVLRHWDGPNYLEVAKTLYHVPDDNPFMEHYHTLPRYYACHLPMYPLLIRLFAFLSYPVSMIFVTQLSAALAAVAFYYLLKEYRCVRSPFFTAWLSTFLPIRYVLYKSIGATEPLYLALVYLSLIAYRRQWLTGSFLAAGLAGITRITGVLMLPAYFLELCLTRRWKWIPALALIGLPLLATFTFYHYQFQDFFAYLHWNASIMGKVPAGVFREYTLTDQSRNAELYFYFYVFCGVGTARLYSYRPLFGYCLTYLVFCLFIVHEDLSRYLIPISQLTLLVGFDAVWNSRGCKWVLPFVFYLAMFYGNRTLVHNLCNPDDYQKLLQQPSWPTQSAATPSPSP